MFPNSNATNYITLNSRSVGVSVGIFIFCFNVCLFAKLLSNDDRGPRQSRTTPKKVLLVLGNIDCIFWK